MATGAFLIRRSPPKTALPTRVPDAPSSRGLPVAYQKTTASPAGGGAHPLAALRTKAYWMVCSIFFLFNFCNQMVSVHLVNYATDLGTAALVAATLVSVVGLSGVAGRILMGVASDRVGNLNTLILAAAGIALSLIWLTFARELWMFYLFAAVFGFNFGAEVPQQTALVSKLFGLRTMLVGIAHSCSNLGGALGSWVGGKVFDVTLSYRFAFLLGVVAIVCALAVAFTLSKRDRPQPATIKSS